MLLSDNAPLQLASTKPKGAISSDAMRNALDAVPAEAAVRAL
jgi:hypothetical protein